MAIEAISTALQSLHVATEFAKYFKTTDLNLEKAEQKMKVAELLSSLAELKMNLASVQEEAIEREKKISELKSMLELKGNMIWERPFYWRQVEGSNEKEGPFCSSCYDNRGKLIRLQKLNHAFWGCSVTECHFGADDPAFEDHSPPPQNALMNYDEFEY